MRVAYLCTDPGIPVFGTKGAAIHVRELSRALAEAGHEVVVWAARLGGDRPAGYGLPVTRLESTDRPLPGREPGERDLAALRHAARSRRAAAPAVTDFAPEVIYERYSLFGTAGARLARDLGAPLLLEVNAPLSAEARAHRGLTLGGPAEAVERHVLRAADRVIAVSDAVAQWAVASGVAAERVAVVPNGVDLRRFDGLPSAPAARAALGLPAAPTVGFVGSLKAWHGTADLVRAVAQLAASHPATRLLIVGDGPERARLEALAVDAGIADRVTFAGAVAHAAVPAWLAAMDVAVAPYDRAEGCYFSPLKLFEYLAAGRPVVAAAAGQVTDLVRDGRTGWLYRPGDVAALAAALAAALDDPAEAGRRGRAGRARVAARHTWAGVAETVTGLATTALAERARRAA